MKFPRMDSRYIILRRAFLKTKKGKIRSPIQNNSIAMFIFPWPWWLPANNLAFFCPKLICVLTLDFARPSATHSISLKYYISFTSPFSPPPSTVNRGTGELYRIYYRSLILIFYFCNGDWGAIFIIKLIFFFMRYQI